MLLMRLIAYFRNMKTLHIFLLEILAVFIGITASLFIDDWRQRAQDREVLDHLLQETHYNALQDVSEDRIYLGISKTSLEDANQLLHGDTSDWSDEELVYRFGRALWLAGPLDLQPGYRRLLNTSLSIPFDHTMAELDFHFRELVSQAAAHNEIRARMLDVRRQLLGAAGLTDHSVAFFEPPITGPRGDELYEAYQWLIDNPAVFGEASDAGRVRAALATPEVRDLLLELIGLRVQYRFSMIYMGSTNDDIIASIRRYDPDVTLPIGFIELIGDALEGDGSWTYGLPMIQDRDNPNTWRLRVRLVTYGEVKFRADQSWTSSWGAPFASEIQNLGYFQFDGDPSTVFPAGTAQFSGMNIPVEPGVYDVTFNSQSFDYAFDRVDK